MANGGSSAGGWLLKGLGCMALLTLLCCGLGLALLMLSPGLLAGFFLADQPLPLETTERKPLIGAVERTAACAALLGTGRASLPPETVARWLVEDADPGLTVLRFDAEGEEGALAVSIATDESPPRYLNVQLDAAFTMQRGWFTDLRLSRLVLRDHDWSGFLAGQQLAEHANRSLADQRAQDVDLGPSLDSVRLMKIEDGELVLELEPESPLLAKMCRGG